jgi:hypothetical protein
MNANFLQNLRTAKNKVEKKIKSLAVDITVRTERLDICKQCEHLIRPINQCSKCGCFVAAKTWVESSSCPLKKW